MMSNLVSIESNLRLFSASMRSNRWFISALRSSISSYTRSNDSLSSRYVTCVSSSRLTRLSSRLRVRPKSWSSGSLAWVIIVVSICFWLTPPKFVPWAVSSYLHSTRPKSGRSPADRTEESLGFLVEMKPDLLVLLVLHSKTRLELYLGLVKHLPCSRN
jgi:hypothetical protein